MARYKHLPIYKATYELLTLITKLIRNFPRDYKFSLGDRLRSECIELVVNIYRANSSSERLKYLDNIQERIQVIELLLRLSRDMKFISIKQFSETVEITDGLIKQTTGWTNHTKNTLVGAE